MPVLRKLREFVIGKPDRTREELCAVLQSYGVEARLAKRVRMEELIGSNHGRWILCPFYICWVSSGSSLGVIDTSAGSIQWVNVLEYHWEDSPRDHWYVYGIPDRRINTGFPKVHLKSALIRKSWLGETIGVKWKGKGYDLGERLSQHPITSLIFDSHRQGIDAYLGIDTEPNHSCWTIATKTIPTRELWDCYQAIAGQLQKMTFPG